MLVHGVKVQLDGPGIAEGGEREAQECVLRDLRMGRLFKIHLACSVVSSVVQ